MKKIILLTILAAVFFTAHAFASEFGDVDIHGFISQGYLQTDKINFLAETKDGTFQFNELALNFATILSPGLRVGMQLFAYDLGDRGNDELTVEWCYADYQWKEWLGFRVGSMKTPHGLYNEIRDMDMLRPTIFLPMGVYSEVIRDELQSNRGMAAYGLVSLGGLGRLSYLMQLGQMTVDKDKGFARAAELLAERNFELQGFTINADTKDIHSGYTSNGVLKWYTFIDGLMLGITGFNNNNMDTTIRTNGSLNNIPFEYQFQSHITEWWGMVASGQYEWYDLVLTYEYFRSDMKTTTRDSETYVVPIFGVDGKNEKSPLMAWYINLSYRFSAFVECAYTYTEYYENINDRDGTSYKESGLDDYLAWAKSSVFSTRFDINDNWILKLEYTYTDGQLYFNPAENDKLSRYWSMYGIKVTYTF
ncbi:MAG: hypothetical protein KJ737_15210 [Proteobacteria bacterium]|nr:hypothetical protein [Pseudomonadota bacterium]